MTSENKKPIHTGKACIGWELSVSAVSGLSQRLGGLLHVVLHAVDGHDVLEPHVGGLKTTQAAGAVVPVSWASTSMHSKSVPVASKPNASFTTRGNL